MSDHANLRTAEVQDLLQSYHTNQAARFAASSPAIAARERELAAQCKARAAKYRSFAKSPPRSAAMAATTAPAVAAPVDAEAVRAKATMSERLRWATVFGAEASKGQERAAAVLLADVKGYSAASIIETLGKTKVGNSSASAPARPAPKPTPAATAAEKANNHGWGEIHAEIRDRSGRA